MFHNKREKYFKYSHNPIENLFVDSVENQKEIKPNQQNIIINIYNISLEW